MSSKLLVPVLAAPLALAAIAPGPVLALSAEHYHAYGYRYQPYSYDLHQPFPHGARGPFTGPQIFEPRAARPFQTDPDPSVRFDLNRDANRGRS